MREGCTAVLDGQHGLSLHLALVGVSALSSNTARIHYYALLSTLVYAVARGLRDEQAYSSKETTGTDPYTGVPKPPREPY